MTDQGAQQGTVLQGLIWPEAGLCTERDLYMRLSDRAAMSQRDHEIYFLKGGAGLLQHLLQPLQRREVVEEL